MVLLSGDVQLWQDPPQVRFYLGSQCLSAPGYGLCMSFSFSVALRGLGAIFLCVIVACFFGAGTYLAPLVKFHYEPYTYQNGIGSPERRLLPAVFLALIAPCGILIFAWDATPVVVFDFKPL